MSDNDKGSELEGIGRAAQTGTVPLASGAIMEDIRNVAGRTEMSTKQRTPYRQTGFVPGQTETIDYPANGVALAATTAKLDQQLGFPAHSVIIDNPTKLWIWIQSAQRFACPGLMGAVWQIPKAAEKAEAAVRAPQGVVQPGIGTATQVTITFCEAFLMPSPGIIHTPGGV
jgi:hypothetical protein